MTVPFLSTVISKSQSGSWQPAAVSVWTAEPERFVDRDYGEKHISFFEIMTDELFQEYAGSDSITTRDDLIISKEERDQHPDFWDSPESDSRVTINPQN